MSSASFSLVAFLFLSTVTRIWSKDAKRMGCSAEPLLPERPFVVVWNHPTRDCEDNGVHLDFQKWGIIDNDRDRFFGQKIVLLYNLGKWPHYKNGQPVDGGLPQLADIDAHLAKVDNDLRTNVWKNSFNGLAIIDQEHWRPLYWTNYDSLKIYQEKSLALAKQRFPQYDKNQVLNEAIKEFDTAARKMMEQTLIKVTTKRPTGKWGYYLFPRCWDRNCNTTTFSNNDRMSWVFEKSTGLYPSIYFKLKEPPVSRGLRIKHTLHEAIRIKAKYAPHDAPVMPYSQSQDGPYQMFGKTDLSYAILQPANMGSSGVVLWGSTREAKAKNECLILQEYIENTLGPYSLSLTNFFGNCTQQLCNSNGRCVRKDYEAINQYHARESNRTACVIPDDQLSKSKKYDGFKPRSVQNVSFKKSHQRKMRRRSFLFLTRLKKRILRENKFHSSNILKMSSDFRGKSPEVDQEMSLIELPHNTYKALEGMSLGLRMSKGGNSNKHTKESHFDQDDHEAPTWFGNPNYDFDDYVCKCYPGYSGIHCETHYS